MFSLFGTRKAAAEEVKAAQDAELARLRSLEELHTILGERAGVGLWDAILFDKDAMHPNSIWTWSAEFRRLLGFTSVDEFPNLVTSWSDRLHPEDAPPTFAAFAASLEPSSKGYDVTYRLKMRDGSYRWFRATGGAAHSNGRVRCCGSLVEIHAQKMAEVTQANTAAEQTKMVTSLASGIDRFADGD
ncbi:MAG: chemotaxis protein, partial [Alphaproteobacteria bacterium]